MERVQFFATIAGAYAFLEGCTLFLWSVRPFIGSEQIGYLFQIIYYITKESASDWIDFYNNKRVHASLNYKTPKEVYAEKQKDRD